jgi:hypothetical protein
MTLLIACILIYGFGLPWWMYALTLFVWVWHITFRRWIAALPL